MQIFYSLLMYYYCMQYKLKQYQMQNENLHTFAKQVPKLVKLSDTTEICKKLDPYPIGLTLIIFLPLHKTSLIIVSSGKGSSVQRSK